MRPRTRSSSARRFLALVALVGLAAVVVTARPAGAQAPDDAAAPPAPAASPAAPTSSATVNEARALLDEAHRLDETTRAWTDRMQRIKLLITDGRGTERRRELVMRTLKAPGGEDKTSTVFLSPPEVRGTAFLQFAHQDRDAEQWLFLPALGRIRQIAAQSKNESFMGTDFSYRDLELLTDVFVWTEEEAPAKLLGTETIDGQEAAIIELAPKAKDVGYQKIRLAMTKADHAIRRMEFFGSGDTPKKRLKLDDLRMVGAIPTAFKLEMVQTQTNSKTDVDVVDVRYNQNIPEELFTTRALERGALDAE
jgi:outer membrane lipoprotein-sorting protein